VTDPPSGETVSLHGKLRKVYQESMSRTGVIGSCTLALLLMMTPAGAVEDPQARAPGTITEYPPLADYSYPASIVAGPDDALWFTELEGDRIGRMATDGTLTEYAIPGVNSDPWAVTVGPDGALWFTVIASHGQFIERLTTDGDFSRFRLADHHYPYWITTGPDGNLWFTEDESFDGDRAWIGRITPLGAVTHFELRRKLGAPAGIAAGPDGNLWFVTLDGWIGRITPRGHVAQTSSIFSGHLIGIIAGPDGAMWFTERNGYIGRVTTDLAEVSEQPLPGDHRRPFGIMSGPDGALWFTDTGANVIGRITTDFELTDYPIPTRRAKATSIVTGSDGELWFTEFNSQRVARIAPS
jgi:streptogramin lyase